MKESIMQIVYELKIMSLKLLPRLMKNILINVIYNTNLSYLYLVFTLRYNHN